MNFRESLQLSWRQSRTDFLLWPAALLAMVLFVHFAHYFNWLAYGIARLSNKNISFFFIEIILSPVFENLMMIAIVKIVAVKTNNETIQGIIVGLIAAFAYWRSNVPLDGIYYFTFFFAMARIYSRLAQTGRAKFGYWLTVAFHALSKAIVLSVRMILA
jgi:hypothetical protein